MKGCEKLARKANVRRCEDHAVLPPTPEEMIARGKRPPKLDLGMLWCEPCHEWVMSLLHVSPSALALSPVESAR